MPVGDETWEYVVVGDGPRTVLFRHDLSGAHDSWWQQLQVLAPTHRAIAVSYPPVPTLAELVSRSVWIERFRRTAVATGPGDGPWTL